jgi:hypothetical protein
MGYTQKKLIIRKKYIRDIFLSQNYHVFYHGIITHLSAKYI